ncbi:hypothetical protein JZ751_007681 [Albula glossodonta]|uniref:Dynein light chain Tctex-type 3 n=1 Tax=Albula glossodonta TaxID=121402 RepID=A0A8T2N1X9_9TELE|nr:hypothetical protein JZ751_007681 [Albula glossodonta]
MEEYHSGDEVPFNPDEASNYVKECIEGIIGGVDYNQNKVNQWTATIVEHSLTQLVKQGKPFKYIVNCAVMQKSGAGLHTANSCYWDTATDGKTSCSPLSLRHLQLPLKSRILPNESHSIRRYKDISENQY